MLKLRRILTSIIILISIGVFAAHVSAPALSAQMAPTPIGRALTAPVTTIHFSNYDWQVRSGTGGPGPNIWDDTNAWLDAEGSLHLKITHVVSEWHSVEVTLQDRLGFGTYQFDVVGAIDQLDANVVLGLFNYPPPDVGPDGTNEIDIEFARWGNISYPNGNYTVWPAGTGLTQSSNSFEFALSNITSTHQFLWLPTSINFQSAQGLASDKVPPFASWSYQPAAFNQYIPQQAMPVHINLWLFQGNMPTNGQEVEVVIRKFTFTPLNYAYLPIVIK
jgi:hypothetical protein